MVDISNKAEEIMNELKKTKLYECFQKNYSVFSVGKNKEVNEILHEQIQIVYKDYFENTNIENSLISIRKSSFKRTKKRWKDNAIKDYKEKKQLNRPKELLGEYVYLKDYQMSFLDEGETIEGRINKSIARLEDWVENKNALVTEYMYFHHKTLKQKKTAMTIDLAMFIGNYLLKMPEESKENTCNKGYPFVSNMFAGSRARDYVDLIDSSSTSGYYQVIDTNLDGKEHGFLVTSEYADELDRKVQDLDPMDYFIFSNVMTRRSEDFISNRTIVVKIKDIVDSVYETHGKNNYTAVKNRLKKMANFRMARNDGHIERILHLFEVTIVNDALVETARIAVSDSVIEMIVNNQTYFQYHDKLETLGRTNSLAYQIIMILQKDRFSLISQDEMYTAERDLVWFCSYIRFKKRKSDVLKDIENALKAIISEGIVLKSFYRKRDTFHLEYYPVEKEELDDLITNSAHIPKIQTKDMELPMD